MRKLSQREIESELIFIKRNLEYENMTVSKKTLKRCRRILEGKLDPEEAMEEIRKKYKLKKSSWFTSMKKTVYIVMKEAKY